MSQTNTSAACSQLTFRISTTFEGTKQQLLGKVMIMANMTLVHTCDWDLLKLPLSYFIFQEQNTESLVTQLGARPVIFQGTWQKQRPDTQQGKISSNARCFSQYSMAFGEIFFNCVFLLLYNVRNRGVLFKPQRN